MQESLYCDGNLSLSQDWNTCMKNNICKHSITVLKILCHDDKVCLALAFLLIKFESQDSKIPQSQFLGTLMIQPAVGPCTRKVTVRAMIMSSIMSNILITITAYPMTFLTYETCVTASLSRTSSQVIKTVTIMIITPHHPSSPKPPVKVSGRNWKSMYWLAPVHISRRCM